jgi:hypothetical protein
MFLLKCSKELPLHYAHMGLDILAQFSSWLTNALPYLVDDNLRDLPFLRGATGRCRTKDLGFIATAADNCDSGLQVFCTDTKKWSALRCVTMYNKRVSLLKCQPFRTTITRDAHDWYAAWLILWVPFGDRVSDFDFGLSSLSCS